MDYIKATEEHIASLTEIRMKYLSEDFGSLAEDKETEIRKSLPGYFEAHLGRNMFAYLAKKDGKIIASAFLVVSEKPANPSFPRGRTGTVMNVYTEKEYRRQGIASALMKMLINDAKRLELDYLELKATAEGYPLYRSLGFAEANSAYKEMKYFL